MGYDFIGQHRKTDEDNIFYTSCMYSYQPIFKECFKKEIAEFSGRVTKQKILEFEDGLKRLKSHPEAQKQNNKIMYGYIDNILFDDLIVDLYKLLELMKDKKVGYLLIG